MRIAMVAACPFPWRRGTPIRIYRLAEALSYRGHEVHVITYHLGDRLVSAPFEIHRIPRIRTYTKHEPGPSLQKLAILDPLLALKLRSILRHTDFDIVHAHHYEGLLVAVTARAFKNSPPLVYDAHTLLASELHYYPLGLPRVGKVIVGRTLDRQLPRLAHHIISVTDDIRDTLIRSARIIANKITVISNGVEHTHFAGEPGPNRNNANGKRLVFAGNLAAYQGIDLLLQAFREIVSRRPQVLLLLVTDSDFDPYEALARALGIRGSIEIVRSDYVSLPRYLDTADVLLNPRSSCDGVPQKLLNYMASGKPIVSFAGSAKLLKQGESGLIVKNDDALAFAEAVMRIVDDPVLGRSLGANARRLIESEYTWDKVAAKVEAVYEKMLFQDRE
jgi:glycosyltransferase involved in cell wall biosynthesis